MPKISWRAENDFAQSKKYLRKLKTKKFQNTLMKYAEIGLQALKDATPKDSGFTAESWYVNVVIGESYSKIYWHNSHFEKSNKTGGLYPIAILIDVGHGTGTGGYVGPANYIEPALQPVIEEISESIRKEVLS